MGFSVCPTAVVAAPAECVWDLLADPTSYDAWWDARTVRIVPAGPAAPGQVVYAKTRGLGKTWDVTLTARSVDPSRRQLHLRVALPLGVVNDNTITATALDAISCRVAFG